MCEHRAGVEYRGVCKYKSASVCLRNPAEIKVVLWKTWPWTTPVFLHAKVGKYLPKSSHNPEHLGMWLCLSCPTCRTCVTLGHLPCVAEDFQLHPLCNAITTLPDACYYHLWGRIKGYSELYLLHILGFNEWFQMNLHRLEICREWIRIMGCLPHIPLS